MNRLDALGRSGELQHVGTKHLMQQGTQFLIYLLLVRQLPHLQAYDQELQAIL